MLNWMSGGEMKMKGKAGSETDDSGAQEIDLGLEI